MIKEEHRLDLLEIDPDPRQRHTIWSILISGQIVWLSLYATSQEDILFIRRVMCLMNLCRLYLREATQ